MNIVNAGYGYREDSSFSINRPYGSGNYVLIVVRSSSYFVLDGKKEIYPPNSVILYREGTPQHYGAVDGNFINDFIHFVPNKNDLKKIEELGISFDTVLPLYDTAPISMLVKNLLYENYSRYHYRAKSSHLFFDLILHKIADLLLIPVTTDRHFFRILTALRNDIYLHPSKEWKLEEICNNLNFSRSYIQHSYKEYFGESIQSSVTNSRMEYARQLLSSTDSKISNVAARCGYHSDVHFIRIFKNKTGITPSVYRRINATMNDSRQDDSLADGEEA